MKEREAAIKNWFTQWLTGIDSGISSIFSENAVYIESWGPEYHGARAIQHWFEEWNTRGKVLVWDIRQFLHQGDQTVVEWYFQCEMKGEAPQAFDGLSLIRWSRDGKIDFLKEFGCNIDRYNPYTQGPKPKFKGETSLWF